MTDAALQLRNGETREAVKLITEARAQVIPEFYLPYANDFAFRKKAETFPEIADALGRLPAAPL